MIDHNNWIVLENVLIFFFFDLIRPIRLGIGSNENCHILTEKDFPLSKSLRNQCGAWRDSQKFIIWISINSNRNNNEINKQNSIRRKNLGKREDSCWESIDSKKKKIFLHRIEELGSKIMLLLLISNPNRNYNFDEVSIETKCRRANHYAIS